MQTVVTAAASRQSSSQTASAAPSAAQTAGRLAEFLTLADCKLAADLPVSARSTKVGDCRFVFVASDGPFKLTAKAGTDSFVLWVSLEGELRIQLLHEMMACGPRAGCVWTTDGVAHVMSTGPHKGVAILVSRTAMEQELARILGQPLHEPLQFSSWMKVDTPRNVLGTLLDFLRRTLEDRDSAIGGENILSSATEKLFLAALLTAQTSNYTEPLNGLNVVVTPRYVQLVTRAVKTDPSARWSLTDMAKEGGVSVRAICDGFRRYCGCSPKQFVQNIRLATIREALQETSRFGSVAELARQHGFQHPGRFSAIYAKAYGESPSDTVRRVFPNPPAQTAPGDLHEPQHA